MTLQVKGIIFALLAVVAFAKKDTSDFMSYEEDRLGKAKVSCSLKQLKQRDVISLWSKQQDDETAACLIKFVQENPKDGFIWSALGTLYIKKGRKFSSHSSACFRQALKLSGKFPAFVKEWSYIGPFVIGKTEFDGDPIESFGGIANVSRFMFERSVSFPSELVPDGKLEWITFEQASPNQAVRIRPKVNWNDLVSSLGSLGITEWQGWAVGHLAINQDELTVLVQCLGVSTVFIDGTPVAGDVYHRERFQFAVQLSRGVHLVTLRLRAKVEAVYQCSFKAPLKEGFEILTPTFLPDLYDGYLFSSHISIPVSNYKASKWLKILKVTVSEDIVKANLVDNQFPIAPGQTQPIIFKLSSLNPRIIEHCEDIELKLVIKTSEGQATLPLTLRCRKKSESFLFTFLDHDGSVQHAAAIEPIELCQTNKCPVLLTLHGTTVPPQNQADSYKRMVKGSYQFGVQGMWLLAPTRHGAHNWEGPGALTAMTALESLSTLTRGHAWLDTSADSQHVLFEGHSMGGHGAWHLATHFPDRAIGLAALAGWIKKEEYGDSNLFFKHDIATSHTDASVKAVMEACIGENDADRHVSNLWKIPVLCRVGGNDRTVHPFFTRRMYRLLKEEGADVTFTELKGREHWWWDTLETNDGGVVNDKEMRDFAAKCLSIHNSQLDSNEGACTTDGCQGDKTSGEKNMWKRPDAGHSDVAELVTVNPAFGEGLRGVRILLQTKPFRTSRIKINITGKAAILTTSNVKWFTITEPANRPVAWLDKEITVDGSFKISKEDTDLILQSDTAHLCKRAGAWGVCKEDVHTEPRRGPLTLGPARRVAEANFVIVVGTQGNDHTTQLIQSYAVYIANQFFLTSDTLAPVVRDEDITAEQLKNSNVILLGNPTENKITDSFMERIFYFYNNTVGMEECNFSDSRTGVMSLVPHGARRLAMILMGTSLEGLRDVVSLATPTIPPMARSPFSNLLPDFVVTGDRYRRHGPGGFLCAGFFDFQWSLRQDLISCTCE